MSDRDIDTKSNLNSQVLRELLTKLSLDSTDFETKLHFLDFSLLGARNQIAHGEHVEITKSAYEEYHFEVLELIELVRLTVSNGASTRQYRRL